MSESVATNTIMLGVTGEVRVSPTITDYHLTLAGNFSASPPVLPGVPPLLPSNSQEHSHPDKGRGDDRMMLVVKRLLVGRGSLAFTNIYFIFKFNMKTHEMSAAREGRAGGRGGATDN